MKSLCIIAYADYLTDARVMRHAEAASRDGYTVDVVTPANRNAPSKEVTNFVTVYRLQIRHYGGASRALYLISYLNFFVQCFFWISWQHLRKGYDVVQVCNMPDFLVFSTALPKLMGAKIILDIHDPMPEMYIAKFPGSRRRGFYRLLLLQERLSAAYSDRIITVSEPVKNDVLVQDGIDGNRISVITNFPDDEIFKARDQFSISYPIQMIYYGTIAPRFDLQGILSAIAGVRQRDKIVLRIIGKGTSAVSLREAIGSLKLEDLVEFDDTVYPLRELPGILWQYHLGVVPYLPSPATDYMLPVKLMELLAMGIPSITIANAAIRYYIDESMYFAYNPRDMSTFTRTIEDIIDNPSILLNKRNAILEAPNKLLWKATRANYLNLLAQLSR